MNIGVIGTGYVGLVMAACLADFGHHVLCMDNNSAKIAGLKNNIVPIYEPGITDLVHRGKYYQRLRFTTSLCELVSSTEIIFIAVGTPPNGDGTADTRQVLIIAEKNRRLFERAQGHCKQVNRSRRNRRPGGVDYPGATQNAREKN